MRINAQGGELVLRNEHGDTIIVPRERRKEAMKALLKDDHRAIDSLALQLPKAESYAAGGTVLDGQDPLEGMMGPETTITAKRPEKSIGNFFQRWGHEHSENPTFGKDSFLGAIGSGIMSLAQLPQAAATYMLDPKGNVLPSKALQGTQIQKDIEMSAAQGNIGAKILKRPIVQDMLLDPLLLTSEIAKGVSKGSELINGLKKSELINDLGNKYLPNAYKLNPYAFRTSPENFYRQIDNVTYNEGLESGLIRGKQDINMTKGEGTININKAFGDDAYYNKGSLYYKNNSDLPYLFEAKLGEDKFIPKVNGRTRKYTTENTSVRVSKEPLPINDPNITTYKKDWLKGYKEVPKPKSTLSPISKSWQIQDLPGLHLQSTMSNGPISKIIEPKTGLINTEQALAIIAKESGGNDKVALIKQGLGENIPKKMDFNDFRKTVQDQLIPLERQFAIHSSDYGIERLGYSPKLQGSVFNRFQTFMNTPVSDLGKSRVLENQTLILGNKGKFGRGSSAHSNPEETLGHAHFLRDAETPDVLTVTQIQSDAFQGTHRIIPKTQQEALEKVNKLKEESVEIKSMFGDGKESSNAVLANYEKHLQLDEASAKNFTQKQLLDKNHQERYLQELVDYAGKRGDVNKVRVPTSETAAKIQGYSKQVQTGDNTPGFAQLQEDLSIAVRTSNEQEVNRLMKLHDEMLNTPYKSYSSEHQTILKKYKDNPKIIKKLFGEEPKVVTDSKGNTWYEFDIPKKFKEGKGEIKALSTLGATLGVKQIIDNNKQQ
ncbi:hypothetical protein EKK58_07710 [Candidatus Dependentiae bacterium]|nr:MAG: hypothetical protein EKK58_07710 [Candidatus Dependentiae bacterium]